MKKNVSVWIFETDEETIVKMARVGVGFLHLLQLINDS